MKALIDGDILLYQYGSLLDEQGRPLTWNLIVNHLNAKIREICEKVGADEYTIYISGKGNFREKEATIKPYKGNRKDLEKPHAYDRVKKYLTSGVPHPFEICTGYEADDGMSMAQIKALVEIDVSKPEEGTPTEPHTKHPLQTCICSNDKDLRMVPGYHYSWKVSDRIKEKPITWIAEKEGLKWFFTQLLMGDSTDNIPGLYRVGPTHAKKMLDGVTEPLKLYTKVQSEYEARFGSYWKMFMHENARLLWMLRTKDDDIREMLELYELRRLKELEEQEPEF